MNGEVDGPEVTEGESQEGEGRMWGLLQDLLEAHGREGTAALLGVSERTLRRAESNRHVTPQLQKELERYVEGSLGDGPASQSQARELALELASLKTRVDGLERGTREAVNGLRKEVTELAAENERLRKRVDELEQHSEGGVGRKPAGADGDNPGPSATTPFALDRRFPELVTADAADGEEAVYGAATALAGEWRAQRRAYLDAADDWTRLTAELRMTELEVELIDVHELTLPPSDVPWDGIRRHSELRRRQRTLERLRRERRRARVKRWLLRLATLGWQGR
ncbi:MAG: hypothetical protein OXH38_10330 [Chloroflexi bacterium]|nr:hypothetical protein [Chloroflexota bacterium]